MQIPLTVVDFQQDDTFRDLIAAAFAEDGMVFDPHTPFETIIYKRYASNLNPCNERHQRQPLDVGSFMEA